MRNQQKIASSNEQLRVFRQQKWQLYTPIPPVAWRIGGNEYLLRPGLTFTPFANAVACNAHCSFCSEELVRNPDHQLTAKRLIDDEGMYFNQLQAVLAQLQGLHLGLSISGLEPTAAIKWLVKLLETLKLAETEGIIFDEKVLYTNGSGFVTHPESMEALVQYGLHRIELSRCHYEEAINQQIMRFNRNQPIWRNAVYENLVRNFAPSLHLKNSCILTKTGISSLAHLEAYLQWAANLGVKEVVFRELSRLNGSYQPNTFTSWIEANRVAIEPLLTQAAPSLTEPREGWQYAYSTFGYYYYNEHFTWNNQIEVIFETSSYEALQAANATGIIQKLIFHSNGKLTGDWDPNSHVLLETDKRVLV